MSALLVNPDAALERLRAVCIAFPGAEEKLSHGTPAFHVRGRMFVMFVDDHHADGRLAAWCKAMPSEQRALVATDPDRFFVPPYVGVKGWVGVRLDRPNTDWIELAILLEKGWSEIAPKRIAHEPSRPRVPPPVRAKTDGVRAKDALERLSAVCLALPEATCEREGRHASFAVGKKAFAQFLDNHHGDGRIGVCVRAARGENEKLVASNPKRFYLPAYIGAHGWVALGVDAARVNWRDVAERVTASYRSVAPKRLLAEAKPGTARSRSTSRP